MRLHRLASASALAIALACKAAGAQTTAAPAASDQTGGPVQTPMPSWASEVVVTGKRGAYATPDASTATRIDTPLIDVPQSVEVITKTLIQEQDARTLADALANVSGVTPERPEESIFTTPIIHGFPADGSVSV